MGLRLVEPDEKANNLAGIIVRPLQCLNGGFFSLLPKDVCI